MTMPAVFTLPTHVTLIPWWYDTQDPSKVIRESVRTFGRWGFHVAGGAGGNLGNIQYWSAMLHDTGSDFYGHAPFEATLSKEEAIAAFGAYSWRNFDQPVSTIAANHSFELCNGLDDDGDNAIDEDYNLGSDADHCGTCEHSCDMAHGWGQCDAGTCSIAGCVRGFRDLDGQVDNGCEAPE